MRLYLVGGAVRDMLLGRQPKDRDYVAVGATPADIERAFPGAQLVGKSFPVFLVPGLGEVALARTERATGIRHTDFEVRFDAAVTLEEDLLRRDLTINAMAIEVTDLATSALGELVDPHGGRRDLAERTLRHVSGAFVEDALRIYRVGRFAAQYGFSVAGSTFDCVASIASRDRARLDALPGERVGGEFYRAMAAPQPEKFIETLAATGALGVHFPELAALAGVPAGPPAHHPEDDALVHTLMAVREARRLGGGALEVTAALLHDLGKGLTPAEQWPHHRGHESSGAPLVRTLCDRLRLPADVRNAAVLACEQHLRVHRFLEMQHGKKVDLIALADKTALKAEGLALVAEADARGRAVEAPRVAGASALRLAAPAARAVHHRDLAVPPALRGREIGLFVRQARARAVERALSVGA